MTGSPRRALVTGASSGIGAAVARALAARGDRVALLARRAEKLSALADEIARSAGERPLCVPCDVRRPEDIARAFDHVAREFGGLDLLVNNAGIGYRARVEQLDPQIVRDLLDTNVVGLLHCCQAALPLLRRGNSAVVVNIASVVGRRGIPGQAVYSASKAAVISISEALRIEWEHERIAVCTLNPGLTATGFFEAQANPSALAAPDMTRSSGPDEVAQHVLALDRSPRPEVWLRRKWRWLSLLSLVAPRTSDRVLRDRLGWSPER
jgi:NAD(P)-dependent dehydrogenase (short-subunit alcohol dehydrogenase family)